MDELSLVGDWFVDCLIYRLIDWLIALVDCLVGWPFLGDWLVDGLVYFGLLLCRLVGWLVG